MSTGNPPATDADVARLSGLLEDLASRYGDVNDKVTTNQVTIRSVEATLNHLVSDNAQLKASVSLLEEAVSQKAQLQDISQRLAAMEASNFKPREPVTPCSLPFTEVFGRCVYVNTKKTGTWEEMRDYCKSIDSDLVIIKSADFMWHLIRHLHETGQDRGSYWVGGHRKSDTAAFYWVDGSPMMVGTPFWGYWNDFGTQQPYDGAKNELHICIFDRGLFFLHSCGSHDRYPICQKK
ncbi:CD209 antigen-like protein C [Oratosquilla oratoria]